MYIIASRNISINIDCVMFWLLLTALFTGC